MTCDFCLVRCREAWAIQVGAFREPVWKVTNIEGEWAACDGCYPLIAAGDLAGLVARVAAAIGPANFEEDKARRSYELLFRNIEGQSYRFTDQDTFQYVVVCPDGTSYKCNVCDCGLNSNPDGQEQIRRGALPLCLGCAMKLMAVCQARGLTFTSPAMADELVGIIDKMRLQPRKVAR